MHERSLPAAGRLVLAAALVALLATNAGAQRVFDPESHGHLWPKTDFSRHSVPLSEIFMSGIPRDGIPPIDDPVTGTVAEASEVLGDTEPVITVHLNGKARAYPLGVLMRHEIVNDDLGGVPIAVTFCPLCNSAVVFDRRVDGQVLDFGVTGNLRHSDLVMWDRQTESWWQQFVGEAIAGTMTGTLLEMIPVRVESYSRFRERFPDGTANLGSQRFGGFNQAYLFNPYEYYDSASRPMLFFGEPPANIAPLAYVVAVGDEAWSLNMLRERRRVEAGDLVITWEPGQNAVMDAPVISQGRDIGNVTVQRRTDEGLVDAVHDVTFAFSFNAFHPDGAIHR